MNRKDTLRLLALALCLLFVGAFAPAESPVSVPGEAEALEAGEIDLPAVPGELPGFELAAPQDAGAKVVITRTSNDVMLTNIERATMLNEAGVDVALQLHCNSVSNTSAHGNSGYIRTTGDWVEESRAFSKAITAAISKECGCANLGVLVYNGYMSLNWTTTPSVLLEMGYLSNRTEDRLLATDEYRQKMAQGIFNGLCEYFGR